MSILVRIAAAALWCLPACAATLNLGLVSFDVLIPGSPGSPGVNVFQIVNFTGDPSSGGFALPPDFPVFTSLTFTGGTLTMVSGGTPLVVPMGDVPPGPISPTSDLEFPETTLFSSAVFSASLSQASFLLQDGLSFVADSATISAALLPSAGSWLTAGSDLALITVEGRISDVPEPAAAAVFCAGLIGLHFVKRFVRAV